MSLRENPAILRQGFTKLWDNTIILPTSLNVNVQYTLFYKLQNLLKNLIIYKYTSFINTRKTVFGSELEDYFNFYKYRKNLRKSRKNRFRFNFVVRKIDFKRKLAKRFEKGSIKQQVIQQITGISINLINWFGRLRESIRRLKGVNILFLKWAQFNLRNKAKQKYFTNTCNIIVLLHFYKAADIFSKHFGRELEKVRKKFHWQVISIFKSMLFMIPQYSSIGRRFYGLQIEINGRPKGRNRTVTVRLTEGTFAPQSYKERISFGYGVALAKVGVFGIRTRLAY